MEVAWKNEIFESLLNKDISCALEQKRNYIPKKLYRYRSVLTEENKYGRVSEILDGNIYLAHPKELNDPLESRFLLSNDEKSIERLNEKLKKNEEYRKKLGNVDSTVFSSDMLKSLSEVIQDFIEYKNLHYNELFRSTTKMACFTTKPLNLPMWNHYASCHKGFCLEYDTDKMTTFLKNKLYPVLYVEKLPNLIDVLLSEKARNFILFDLIASQKLQDWSYEDEWRLLFNVGDFYFSENEVPEEFYNKGKLISFIKPSKIILGMNIEERSKKDLKEMANIANIPISQVKYTEYGLTIE